MHLRLAVSGRGGILSAPLVALFLMAFAGPGRPAFGKGKKRVFEWPGRFNSFIAKLRASSSDKRLEAIEELASYRLRRIEKPFLRLLDDEVWKVRVRAAEVLVQKKSRRVVGALIDWMNDFETKHRVTAIRLLGGTGLKSAVRPIKRALRDFDPEVRIAALRALGKLKATSALTAVLARLDDDEVKVRIVAVSVLGQIPHPRAVISLMGKLGDAAKEVRKKVLVTLGDLGDARAAPAVLRALKDPVDEIRVAAAQALGNLPTVETVAALVRVLREGTSLSFRRAAASALARIGTKKCAEPLVQALRSSYLRSMAKDNIKILGKKAVPFLVRRLSNPQVDPDEAQTIVKLLGQMGDARASRVLIAELDRHRVQPQEVIEALHICADTSALIPLVRRLKKSTPQLQDAILEALEPIVDQRASGAILRLLDSKAIEVRMKAVRLLGRLRVRKAVSKLLEYTEHSNEALKLAAIRALGLIGDPTATSRLSALLRSSDKTIRMEASDALGRVADPAAAPKLLQQVKQNTEWTAKVQGAHLRAIGTLLRRKLHRPTLRALAKRAASASFEHALPALEAIQASRSRAAVAPLLRLWKTSIPDAHRIKIAAFFGDLGSPRARPVLISALAKRKNAPLAAAAAWSLGELGDRKALPALLQRMKKARHPALRINIAAAIGKLVDRKHKTLLVKMLQDPNPYVRLNAAMGLTRICRRGCTKSVGKLLVAATQQTAPNPHLSRHVSRALQTLNMPTKMISQVRGSVTSLPEKRRATILWRNLHDQSSLNWIAFELTDSEGAPRKKKPFLLVLGDGFTRAGYSDPLGMAREEKIPVGTCSLEFPRAWPEK
jgi:HEAT repeat protein